MTTEELLKPRWKVIADFPGNPYTIGQILTYPQDIILPNGYLKYLYLNYNEEYKIDSYPSIFQKLKWWEERNMADMPQYLKRLDCPEVIRSLTDFKECQGINYPDLIYGSYHISLWEPATEEEYENQK